MKKKLACAALAAAMSMTLLVGCGKEESTTAAGDATESATQATTAASEAVSDSTTEAVTEPVTEEATEAYTPEEPDEYQKQKGDRRAPEGRRDDIYRKHQQ